MADENTADNENTADGENTTVPSGGDEPEVVPTPVEEVQSAPAEVQPAPKEGGDAAAQPAEDAAETTPVVAKETSSHEEYHDVPHPHHKWHAEARVDGHDVYTGYVKDISMHGVHLFLEHNLQDAKFVKLHIHIPPLLVTDPHHILEVTGKVTSPIYDSDEGYFRSTISFLEFTLESDRAYLRTRLAD